MFDSRKEAEAALRADFNPQLAAALAAALVPAIVLEPIPGAEPVLGGTRLGGVPDLPRGMAWPRAPTSESIDDVLRRLWGDVPDTYVPGGKDRSERDWRWRKDRTDEVRAELVRRLPYLFVAQIDLQEAAQLGPVASPLPAEGRLLFFYDLVVGPYEEGRRPARVIWDRSPKETIAPLKIPDDMVEADAKKRKDREEEMAQYNISRKVEGTVYGAPPRSARLVSTLRLPHPNSLELESAPELSDLYSNGLRGIEGKPLRRTYRDALEKHHDHTFLEEAWRRQQLLGSPSPEQSDPRDYAVDFWIRDQQPGPFERGGGLRLPPIEERVRDWRLLLQVDVGDLMREGEGSIYFVMRAVDLEERRFDKVIAVYEQT